jgi:Tn3 transposase DDE domain
MQDQLGALGLALNAVVLFNTLYIDTAVRHLAASGFHHAGGAEGGVAVVEEVNRVPVLDNGRRGTAS